MHIDTHTHTRQEVSVDTSSLKCHPTFSFPLMRKEAVARNPSVLTGAHKNTLLELMQPNQRIQLTYNTSARHETANKNYTRFKLLICPSLSSRMFKPTTTLTRVFFIVPSLYVRLQIADQITDEEASSRVSETPSRLFAFVL